jgi:hypothetical protein
MGASNASKMIEKDDQGGPVGSNESVAYWRKIFGLCVDIEDSGLDPGQSVDDLFGGKENFRIHINQGDPTA